MKLVNFTKGDFIQREGHYWMTAEILGTYLGFGFPRQGVTKIFERNKEELTPFTGEVILTSPGGKQETRIFNESGCYIVAMLAKTAKARQFRRALATFLRNIRTQITDLEKLNAECDKYRQDIAGLKLERYYLGGRISRAKMERLVTLKNSGLLSNEEICKVFDLSLTVLHKLLKLYRESQGDFRNLQPQNLQPRALQAGGAR